MKLTESKIKTSSYKNLSTSKSDLKSSTTRRAYSPAKSGQAVMETSSGIYDIRLKRKDLRQFNPRYYVTADISEQDVILLKEVFDYYDSSNIGVLLPNDLKILLHQNGYMANKKTIYELIAEYDQQETGCISFFEFMKAMDSKPFKKETKKQIYQVFKKYDRTNKNQITLQDLKEMNKTLNEDVDEQTMKQMIERASKKTHAKSISFQEFYEVMVRPIE